jgi:hypothetical protein
LTSQTDPSYAYELREGTTCFEVNTVEDAQHPEGRVTVAVDAPPFLADCIEFKKEDGGRWFRMLLNWAFQ